MKSIQPTPFMKWQVGPFSRQANLSLDMPEQFLLLCKVLGVTPQDLIAAFMENIGFTSWHPQGTKAPGPSRDYLMACGYGQQFYSRQEILAMIEELEAISRLFPTDCSDKMLDIHTKWRSHYHRFWFKKWYRKPFRKP